MKFTLTFSSLVLLFVVAGCQPQGIATTQTADLSYQGTELTDKRLAANFTLVDQGGQPAALSDFRGRVVVLSFLDSKCIDVCPFTAVILRTAATQLGSAQDQGAFIAVNTNPLAASVEDVRQWTDLHRLEEIPGWRFLTGQPEMLKAVWRDYSIASELAVAPQQAGNDSQATTPGRVIHTGAIYLIDQQGRERWYFSTEADASTIEPMSRLLAQRVQALLKGE